MKLFIYCFFVLICLSSCVKQEIGDFTLQYNKVFQIQAGSSTNSINVVEFPQVTGWSNFLAKNNLKKTDIAKVSIQAISLEPLLSNEISYRFIEEIKVYIIDPAKPNSRLQIGSAYPQPNERVSNLFLLPGIADIKDFLSLDLVRFAVEIRYREIISSTTDHNIKFEFGIFKI